MKRSRKGCLPRVLHLGNSDKFLPPFVAMVRKEFPDQRHGFRFFRRAPAGVLFPADGDAYRIRLASPFHLFSLLLDLHRCHRIVLHGIFIGELNLFLLMMPWLLRKCYWIIWGGDLYAHRPRQPGARRQWKQFLREQIVPRIGHLVTYIPGDIRLARLWYGARGRAHQCLLYPSNTFKPTELPSAPEGPLTLLVGNSGASSNRHQEIFSRLAAWDRQDFRIICPLSYGSPEYASAVAEEGSRRFGERFVALREFLPYSQYLEILSSVDIAIFAHARQQAMGNTISLLGFGKTVYARSSLTSTRYLQSLGISVLPYEHLAPVTLPRTAADSNRKLVQRHFTYSVLVQECQNIFMKP